MASSGDSTINVSFKSDGYNLLDLLITGKLKYLPVDLAQLKIEKINENTYAVFTQGLKEPLAAQLNVNESEIIFSSPDLELNLEKLYQKKVSVKSLLNLKFKSQFGLYAVKLLPDQITIWGSQKQIDSIDSVQTNTIGLSDLNADVKMEIALKNPSPGSLKMVPDRVKVELNIEKYTEFSLKIPIDVSGINPSIRTFPATTTLYFNMLLKDYKELKTNQFKVVPDVKNIDLTSVKTLNLRIIKQPKITRDVRMDPYAVEFIIVN